MAKLFDSRLRPAVEFLPATVLTGLAGVLVTQPDSIAPLMPGVATATAGLFATAAAWRTVQGARVLAYRSRLRRLPRYVLHGDQIPWSTTRLFLGRGFRWDQRHSQRLVEARNPEARKYLEPGHIYRLVRALELKWEKQRLLRRLSKFTCADAWWNPVRPLPPVGGDAALHGVGLEDEEDAWLPLTERPGHTLVLGTTRVGKTRLAELLVAQDIRRGEVVIVVDPKGDLDLLRRMFAEATRAGKLDKLHIFHLGFPEISERYNPVGEFARITEVATRTTSPLPDEGNSAAFKEFAWRFTNVVAQALVGLGRKPDLKSLGRYVTHIEPLLVGYFKLWLDANGPEDWRQTVDRMVVDEDFPKRLPPALKSRDRYAAALVTFYKERNLYDPVCDGLKSTFEYDKTYFDKLTASLLPLIEKLTSGRVGELIAPDYDDTDDPRPILDWNKVIREGGIVYVGLDALSDPEVAHAVGNAMLADLTSVAGRLYKHGHAHGLPGDAGKRPIVNMHLDEFNEIVGEEFIPMVNKAGGAGIQVTAYTQTASDVEAGIGDRAKAGQIFGNFNNLVMLRVRNEETACLLTDQLPKVRVYTKVAESRTTDNNDPNSPVDFTSQNADRLTETEVEMLTPADLVSLPKGQAFALIEGGRLYKLRLPLAGDDPLLPKDMDEIACWTHERYGLAA
ncbi:MAG: conjugative coupling factor TraD, PFGI-1 class [Gammaproteobacteria bacterium HGW-Gammaproteobacteria-1]|jgi:conjugative coupling factor TraD (TOL family)|nr:MAG: conjugative coupling factor TraD, PFGI-1 class [Gammaproteobacteria bacterium HGW-Gammaproteobacteria-1]PKO86549.1 MAG: conjugative coupling factor TraD, PFGI-1 class [Betaproteobacteria bacterium HGW-Betaproteobacteria-12]